MPRPALFRAIELRPGYFDACVAADRILSARRHWDDILPIWDKYIAEVPGNADAYFERGGTEFPQRRPGGRASRRRKGLPAREERSLRLGRTASAQIAHGRGKQIQPDRWRARFENRLSLTLRLRIPREQQFHRLRRRKTPLQHRVHRGGDRHLHRRSSSRARASHAPSARPRRRGRARRRSRRAACRAPAPSPTRRLRDRSPVR